MQHFLIHRDLVSDLGRNGHFFHSPYPDYYAANALLLSGAPILVNPVPLLVIGISPKSFGYFYFNRREREGGEMLNNAIGPRLRCRLERHLLPGEEMNTNWLAAMELLVENFPAYKLKVDYGSYRFEQFKALYKSRASTKQFLGVLSRHARASEWVLWLGLLGGMKLLHGRGDALLDRVHRKHPPFDPHLQSVKSKNMLELIDAWPNECLDRVAYGSAGSP
jgi:hypothetical protein